MSSSAPTVSVVIPVLNEVWSLKQTVDSLMNQATSSHIKEILLVVAEKTSPASRACIDELIQTYSGRVSVHLQSLPFMGGAIRKGIDRAQGSHILVMFADLESDPQFVPPMIEQAIKHPGAIINASRWTKGGSFSGYEPLKYWLNIMGQKFLQTLFGSNCSDFTYGFRLFPAAYLKNVDFKHCNHSFILECLVIPIVSGAKIVEVPAKWQARSEGESSITLRIYLKYIYLAFQLFFSKGSLAAANGSIDTRATSETIVRS